MGSTGNDESTRPSDREDIPSDDSSDVEFVGIEYLPTSGETNNKEHGPSVQVEEPQNLVVNEGKGPTKKENFFFGELCHRSPDTMFRPSEPLNFVINECTPERDSFFYGDLIHSPDPTKDDFISSTQVDFICYHCNYETPEKETLREHIAKSHGRKKGLRKKKFECPLCSYTSLFKSVIKHHFSVIHKDLNFFVCSYCPYTTIIIDKLNAHMVKHKAKKRSSSSNSV